MKLVVKRSGDSGPSDPIAVHTEEGELLPKQSSVEIKQVTGDMTRVVVEFYVDDEDVRVEFP